VQIHHPGGTAAVGEDEVGGEVVPGGGVIDHHGVGTDDDGVAGGDEVGVGIEDGVHGPGPVVLLGEFADAGGEAAAVGDGLVEKPVDGGGVEFGEAGGGEGQGGVGLYHGVVGTVDGGHVTQAAVATVEQHAATEGGLEADQQIEAVHPHGATAQGLGGEALACTFLTSGIGAGGTGCGETLALPELMAVSHQLD
jgi:hypothetical protein